MRQCPPQRARAKTMGLRDAQNMCALTKVGTALKARLHRTLAQSSLIVSLIILIRDARAGADISSLLH